MYRKDNIRKEETNRTAWLLLYSKISSVHAQTVDTIASVTGSECMYTYVNAGGGANRLLSIH
jgi:hypothetical protein